MYLSRLIKEAHQRNAIVVAYIYGPMGHGKTSYALWTAYEVLKSWDKVLNYLFFDLGKAVETMYKHAERGERVPIMILDDAGFYLNRLTWWERDKVLFMEMFNLARTIASGILFTSPSHELPRQILAKTNYRVSVRPLRLEEVHASESALESYRVAERYGLADGGVAVAKGYQLIVLPSFFKLVRKEYLDYYPLWYPIYGEYQRIRMQYIRRKLREIKESMEGSREAVLEEAKRIYARTGSSEEVYRYLKTKLPRSTAYKYAYYKIPKLVELEKSSSP